VANDLTVTNALTVSNSDLVVSTGNISGAGNLQLGGNITIAGDLTINGTTTTVNSTTLTVDDTNIVIADGGDAANANYGLTIGSTNPVTFQTKQTDGANSLASSVPVSASSYYGSGANLSGIVADTAGGFTLRTITTGSTTFQMSGFPGVYGFEQAHTASMNIDLSGSWSGGDLVIVKSNESGSANPLTIRAVGGTIDGDNEVLLESDYASITLIADGNNGWLIV